MIGVCWAPFVKLSAFISTSTPHSLFVGIFMEIWLWRFIMRNLFCLWQNIHKVSKNVWFKTRQLMMAFWCDESSWEQDSLCPLCSNWADLNIWMMAQLGRCTLFNQTSPICHSVILPPKTNLSKLSQTPKGGLLFLKQISLSFCESFPFSSVRIHSHLLTTNTKSHQLDMVPNKKEKPNFFSNWHV